MTTADPPDRDVLLARIDALERAQHESKPLPLWKNTALLGLIGTLAAVLPPSLTAIHEYYQTEREVQNARIKLQHERTLAYLDRALSPEPEEARQAQVLRFLSTVPDDDDLRSWASSELNLVEESIKALKQQISANQERIAQLEKERTATLDQTTAALQASAEPETKETVVQVAQLEVEDVNRKIEQIQNDTLGLKVRAGEMPAVAAGVVVSPAAPEVEAPRRASQWRLRLPVPTSDLEEAKRQAAKARGAGAEDPTIYRKSSVFYVLVDRFASQDEAHAHTAAARRYLDRGFGGFIRSVDVMEWCSSQRPRQGYIDCE